MDDRRPAVLTEIRSLLDLPAGAKLPPRASLEHTLTSGYAYALGLERERVRLERRLRTPPPLGRRGAGRRDVRGDAGSWPTAERELADVRALLSELREQTFS